MTFQSNTATTASLDVEVRDSNGAKVFQQLFFSQVFKAGQSRVYTVKWTTAATLPIGGYTVKTGAFSPDWATGYGWNDSAATISVSNPPKFTSTVTLSRAGLAPGADVSFTPRFTNTGAATNVNLDLEVRDPVDAMVFQQVYERQQFAAAESRAFSAKWTTPRKLKDGIYTVKTGAFSSDWKTLYSWNNAAASITINSTMPQRYFVDCGSGGDANDGTLPTQAWSSLTRANQALLAPGDSLSLKRGCNWNGPLNASWTGTAAAPITIGAYGEGPLPSIRGSAKIMLNVSGSYLVMQDLAVSATPDRTDAGCKNQSVGDHKGVFFQPNAQHNTFQNSDLTSLSVGIDVEIGANYNNVNHNMLHDVNMMFTLTPQSVNNNDDGGAQALLLEGDYNDIGYNTFTNTSACMYDYLGVAGTAIVLYGGQHNSVHHNSATGNGANFIEAGANVGAGQRAADYNTFAYNINTGSQFFTAHGHNEYWGPALHTKLYNNVTYTTGAGSISCNGCGPDVLIMRNNIVWSDKSATLYVDAPIDEANDIFWNASFSAYNSVPLSPTSRVVNPMFVNPGTDFHLQVNSPAVGTGSNQSVTDGYATDFGGATVALGDPVDIGSFELR